MCIAIPSKVLQVDGLLATVERFGERLTVSLAALPDAPIPGDYLIVMGGRHAVERLDPDTAEETLQLLEDLFGRSDGDLYTKPPEAGEA